MENLNPNFESYTRHPQVSLEAKGEMLVGQMKAEACLQLGVDPAGLRAVAGGSGGRVLADASSLAACGVHEGFAVLFEPVGLTRTRLRLPLVLCVCVCVCEFAPACRSDRFACVRLSWCVYASGRAA